MTICNRTTNTRLFMLLILCVLPGVAMAEVWVFFRSDIPLHVSTVNYLRQTSRHELIFCPVGKTTLSFLESHPPECAVVLGDAAQKQAINMFWKTRILVTLVEQPAKDPRIFFHNTNQPAQEQIQLISRLKKETDLIWYPYSSEQFAPQKVLEQAVASAKMRLGTCQLADPRSLPSGLRALSLSHAGIILPPDPGIMNNAVIESIMLASFRSRLPIAGFSESLVKRGAAFAYVITPEHLASELAALVDMLVANPHTQENMSEFSSWELILNQTVLNKFGIKIPEEIKTKAKKLF